MGKCAKHFDLRGLRSAETVLAGQDVAGIRKAGCPSGTPVGDHSLLAQERKQLGGL